MLNADKNIFVKKRKTLLDNLKNDGSVDDMISIARIIEYQQILRFENTRFKKFKFPKIDSGKKLIDKWLEKIDLKVSLKDYENYCRTNNQLDLDQHINSIKKHVKKLTS